MGKNYAKKTPKSKKDPNYYLSLILRNDKSIFMGATNTHEIGKLIEKLPNKKSSGYDNIDNILLKAIKNEMVQPLSMIFNESINLSHDNARHGNLRHMSTCGFIPKKIQWHIHAGSWSLVNCLAGSLYEALYKVLMNIN